MNLEIRVRPRLLDLATELRQQGRDELGRMRWEQMAAHTDDARDAFRLGLEALRERIARVRRGTIVR